MRLIIYHRTALGRQLAVFPVAQIASDFVEVHWLTSGLVLVVVSPCALVLLLEKVGVFPMSRQATAAPSLAKQ